MTPVQPWGGGASQQPSLQDIGWTCSWGVDIDKEVLISTISRHLNRPNLLPARLPHVYSLDLTAAFVFGGGGGGRGRSQSLER